MLGLQRNNHPVKADLTMHPFPSPRLGDEQSAHASAGASSQGVAELEALEAVAACAGRMGSRTNELFHTTFWQLLQVRGKFKGSRLFD